jgi:hypothetical protein
LLDLKNGKPLLKTRHNCLKLKFDFVQTIPVTSNSVFSRLTKENSKGSKRSLEVTKKEKEKKKIKLYGLAPIFVGSISSHRQKKQLFFLVRPNSFDTFPFPGI